jgi:hypothetical protein
MDPFPPAPKARRPGLGKLWLGIFIALLAVAAVGYFVYSNLAVNAPATARQVAEDESSPPPSVAQKAAPVTRAPNRSDTILTCSAADGTVFYTNATRCEQADLENRVNVMPAIDEPVAQSSRDCLGAQPGGPRVHHFLAVCMEPFNEALELEPFLLESDDPVNSRVGRRYCGLITEGVQAGCMATSDQFCFLDICQAQREAQ